VITPPVLPDWVSAIVKLGIPGAIAIFLVYRLAQGFDVVAVRLTNLEALQVATAAESLRLADLSGRTYMVLEKILNVQKTQCVNVARTDEARANCLREN
jgi:hypothetical protein